jgi:hypothetical protein
VLQQSAGHPEVSGRVIDFLADHDFAIEITQDGSGQVTATVEAQARDEPGSA